ncbi:MAG: hypothetical protein MJ252_12450 [archaeon]|nr:hypothetical protein [archaeon]
MSTKHKSAEKEYKIKEQLYSLYFELLSEIKGEKIEIDEEEYAEKVTSSTIEQLINYIKESIQILYSSILKHKEKKVDPKEFQVSKVEAQLRKYEHQRRQDIKTIFQNALQKEALEFRIDEYIEMEDEFEEMKSKYKYDEGKFLENDRKDNEIAIVRRENTNIKKQLSNIVKEKSDLENKINEQKKLISSLKNKIKKMEEEKIPNDVHTKSQTQSTRNIINYENYEKISEPAKNDYLSNNSFCLKKNNANTSSPVKATFHLLCLNPQNRSCKNKNENNNSHIRLINSKQPQFKQSQSQKNIFNNNGNYNSVSQENKNNTLKRTISSTKMKGKSHNRTNSMSTVLDKKKMNLFSKYFCKSGKVKPKNSKNVIHLSISQSSISKKPKNQSSIGSIPKALDSKSAMNCTSCSTKKISIVNSSGKNIKDNSMPTSKDKNRK